MTCSDIPNAKMQPKPVAEVCLNELGITAANLADTVEELYARCNCICRSSPEELGANAVPQPQENYSPYFDSMRDKTQALKISLDRLRVLLSILEI